MRIRIGETGLGLLECACFLLFMSALLLGMTRICRSMQIQHAMETIVEECGNRLTFLDGLTGSADESARAADCISELAEGHVVDAGRLGVRVAAFAGQIRPVDGKLLALGVESESVRGRYTDRTELERVIQRFAREAAPSSIGIPAAGSRGRRFLAQARLLTVQIRLDDDRIGFVKSFLPRRMLR